MGATSEKRLRSAKVYGNECRSVAASVAVHRGYYVIHGFTVIALVIIIIIIMRLG